MPLSWSMDALGPMCRSAEDCALELDAIHGPDEDAAMQGYALFTAGGRRQYVVRRATVRSTTPIAPERRVWRLTLSGTPVHYWRAAPWLDSSVGFQCRGARGVAPPPQYPVTRIELNPMPSG